MNFETPENWLRQAASEEGFDALGITCAEAPPLAAQGLHEFIAAHYHGDMTWMAASESRRAAPRAMWAQAQSAIMLGVNYTPASDPLANLAHSSHAAISVYAQGGDYHDLIKKRLKALARRFQRRFGGEVKVFVDTAPLMEKPLAQAAGLGWQGKHTNLVSREHGSWLFLGAILTDLALNSDLPHKDLCGQCCRCLDICPTQAFPAPYRLDARRCISYLTIEHKGVIAREFREAIGNRIYGCDDCLAVCPWNKFAREAHDAAFFARKELASPPLADLLSLDDAGFRAIFKGSPIKRIKREKFIRNVLIAAGNSSDTALIPKVRALLGDESPLIRGMAVWALSRLCTADEFIELKNRHATDEKNNEVRCEWQA